MLLLLLANQGCLREDVNAGRTYVKARVMYVSCGGTVLQLIDSTNSVGTN